jgi:hypothetical protein
MRGIITPLLMKQYKDSIVKRYGNS